jgi:hypothetical protein
MKEVTFRCCKYLDHDESHYNQCKLKALPYNLGVYFERGEIWTEGGNPKNVQFCSKRGRLTDKVACLEGAGGECSCYDEEERTVYVNE